MSSKSTEQKSSDHGFNSILSRFEPVIGLEVHCQLKTESKLFCGCKTNFGAMANQNTCPVCLGLPGVLPVLNHEAVEYAIRMALAVGATIRERSVFARKQYFYPDLPKGYQLTQYDLPYCENGSLTLDNGRKINIQRIHMEEDAGKNIHGDNASYVDLNRAGIPLLEIVSAPEIKSPAEAADYLKKLRAIARYLDISDGNLEEGSFRCDANVSLRPVGSTTLGTRTEIKNLNSFRNVEKAITYEILRQADILESGDKVKQVTLQFDAAIGRTIVMRSKEDSPDYRYFPDPDLGALLISEARIHNVRANTRELPEQKVQRFQEAFSITEADARQLTEEKELASFFEDVVQKVDGAVAPKIVANWMLSEYLREFNARQWQFDKPFVSSERFARLLKLLGEGTISGKIAKTVFEEMAISGSDADSIIETKGLVQISDSAAIRAVVDQVIAAHPEQVAQYLSGKQKVYGFLVGQVMKISAGRFNPNLLNDCLKEALLMASPELELKSLLQAELQQGYFTAAYVESGRLDQVQPTLQYFTGKEGRIFDLASLTKALVTGPLVHLTLKAENLDVKAPLAAWAEDKTLPSSLLQLTTDEVLGHVSGLPAWWNFWMHHLDEKQKPNRSEALGIMEKVLNRIPLGTEKKDLYSDVGYILLGYLLEKKAKKSLKPWLQEVVTEPFGYAPDLNLPRESYIATGFCKIRERELRGEVHDENCAAFGGISGHAGLFGSGPSVSQYLKALLRDTMGVQFFEANEKVRRETQRDGLLGFRRGNGQSSGVFANGNGMGHLGWTGTAFWLDWSSKKYGIFLTNRVISGRVSPRITDIRRKVFQLLDASLG